MQVKSFAIWANAEKKQVPALVQNTIKWANDNNLKVYLADRLKSIDITNNNISYFSTKNPPEVDFLLCCLLYTSPSPRDRQKSRMPSSA